MSFPGTFLPIRQQSVLTCDWFRLSIPDLYGHKLAVRANANVTKPLLARA
jgi:hypothetical protein